MLLGDILIEMGKVNPDDVQRALEDSRAEGQLGEKLVALNCCTENDVLEALARQFQLDWIPTVDDAMLDTNLIRQLPLDWARSRTMLPARYDGRVVVLSSDPTQVHEVEDLSLLLGDDADIVLAPKAKILKAIERCYFSRKETSGDFLKNLEEITDSATTPILRSDDDILRVADNAPVTQLVNLILLDAVKTGASDIHVEPYQNRLSMRFRIDGILYERNPPPKHLESALVSRLKVMAHLDIAEKRLPQDGTARVRVGEREMDIRVSTLPVAEGERIVMRLLNRDTTLLPLADLGMSDAMRAHMLRLIREPYGVMWVTGPTGSGKTTTLYAALQELDTKRLNVLTIEDPIEYQLPTISQMSVKPKIGLTFSRGLRHILRQDPDVILVGETRDTETAEIVVRASLTGHLVFSTLHTNDAAGAAVRLVDMGIEPYLVAASTRAAMAQRLARTLCPACRVEKPISDEQLRLLGRHGEVMAGKTVWQAKGCDACAEGYRGRIGFFEILELGLEIQDIIRTGGRLQDVQAAAVRSGMTTLFEDGLQKVLRGQTSLEELFRVVGHDQNSAARA